MIVLFALMILSACKTETDRQEGNLEWELQLNVTNVSPVGMLLEVNPGSSMEEGTISFGRPYWIEKYQNGEWVLMSANTGEYENAFSTERNQIDPGKTLTIGIDWTEDYGKLDPGKYRLTKVWTYSVNGENEDKNISVEFYIERG